MMPSTSSVAYQMSRLLIPANVRIARRYDFTVPVTIAAHSLASNPRLRPAISKLAARRLTSHSNGPGCVSSKSLMSKTNDRSGDAKPPKLARWASPQSCTDRPDRSVVPRSCAITAAAPR